MFQFTGFPSVRYQSIPAHIRVRIHGVCPCGFPHSEIRGSPDICSSPRLFAACHVFLRLSVPGHPPCALSCLTFFLVLFPLPRRIALQRGRTLSFFVFTSFRSHSDLFSFSFSSVINVIPNGISPSDRCLGCLHCCLDLQYSVFKVRPAHLIKCALGLSGLEPPTSRLSGVRSNRLSYKPKDKS